MQTIKTYSPKAAELQPRWRVLDAEGQTLGRMASEIASILKGKDKPTYAPHLPVGDYVVVVNAEKVHVSGLKAHKKVYYRHTGYPAGLRAVQYGDMMERHPTRIIEHAVKGMLPHNVLGRQLLRRLKVYTGPHHPHEAQVRAGQGRRSQAGAPAQGNQEE
ncbi:MAG: 50S ribosomal protein L13 [Chloroflexi bacterium]|nr:50S ribosomal protein L13 [Chloroflexota bacterium]